MVTAVQAIQKQDAVLKNSLGFMGKLATLVSSIWIGNKVADKVMKPSDSNTTLVILDQPGEEEEVGEKKLSTFQKCKQYVCKTRDAIVAQAEAHPYVTSAAAGTMVGLAVLGVRHYLGASTSVVAPAVDAVVVVVGPSERPPFTPPGDGGAGGPPPSTSPAVTEIASVKPKFLAKGDWIVLAGVVGLLFVKLAVPVLKRSFDNAILEWWGTGPGARAAFEAKRVACIIAPKERFTNILPEVVGKAAEYKYQPNRGDRLGTWAHTLFKRESEDGKLLQDIYQDSPLKQQLMKQQLRLMPQKHLGGHQPTSSIISGGYWQLPGLTNVLNQHQS